MAKRSPWGSGDDADRPSTPPTRSTTRASSADATADRTSPSTGAGTPPNSSAARPTSPRPLRPRPAPKSPEPPTGSVASPKAGQRARSPEQPKSSLASPSAGRFARPDPSSGRRARSAPSALTGSMEANHRALANDAAQIARPSGQTRRQAAGRAAKRGAVLAARKGAAAYTGGSSEVALRAIDKARPLLRAIKPALAALPLLFLASVLLLSMMVISGGGSNNSLSYALGSTSADQIPPSYLAAYQQAGQQYNVPWTLLAAIGKVATDQGRSAPSDITDYHAIIDRNPTAPSTLGDTTPVGSSPAAGTALANGPAKGSSLVVLGDQQVPGLASALTSYLTPQQVTVTDDSSASATMASTAAAAPAHASKSVTLVVSAGVNDLANQLFSSTDVATQVDHLAGATTNASCVIWPNLPTSYTGAATHLNGAATAFDHALASAVASHPWITVVDVATLAASTPGVLTSGTTALSSIGVSLVTSAIETAVSTCHETGGHVTGSATVPTKTSPTYSICAPPDCAVNPAIGIQPGEPKGPLLLDAAWLASNQGSANPQSIIDSANLLASALSSIAATTAPTNPAYANYQTDPTAAAALWTAVLAQAPVDLPNSAQIDTSACAASSAASYTLPGTTMAWPFSSSLHPPLNAAYSTSHPMLDFGLPAGTSVLAAAPGTVTVGASSARGTYVTVTSPGGITETYAHLSSASVSTGASVVVGQVIGRSGDTGAATGPVLSFSMANANGPFDPALALGAYHGPGRQSADGTGVDATATASSTTAATPINPCTGTPLAATTDLVTYQSTVGPNQCPTSAPANTLFGGATNIYKICSDSIKQAPTAAAARAIIAALGHLGIPYSETSARNGPNYYDCSSFVTKMYELAGVNIAPPGQNAPTTITIALAGWGVHLPTSAAQPGDLLEYYNLDHDNLIDHVVMKLADGFVVQESGTGILSNVTAQFGTPALVVRVDPSKVGTAPIDLTPAQISATGGVANPADALVLAYAVYYGGLVPGDPAAGTFPSGVLTSSGATSAVASIITQVFPANLAAQAVKVAQCESSLRPNALNNNTDGTQDIGVFQLNTGGTLQGLLTRMGYPAADVNQAYDPSFNVRAAYLLYQERGWEPWYSSQSCWSAPSAG